MKIQLRHLAHARSGDKGDTVNVGAAIPAAEPVRKRRRSMAATARS